MNENAIKVIKKNSLETFGHLSARRGNENLVAALARSHTAPLQMLANEEIPREIAIQIFTNIMGVAHTLSKKHGFSLTSGSK